MKRLRILAVGISLCMLAACGGGGRTTPSTSGARPSFPPYTGPATLGDFSWGRSLVTQMQYVAPVTSGAMEVHVQVSMRDPQGLAAYAQEASDPSSPLYRHFLTPQQIADRFGASTADYQAAAQYFQSFGMEVGLWPQREMLAVTGSLGQFTQAFGTQFGTYRLGSRVAIAPISTPHLARPAPIAAVEGLVSVQTMHSDLVRITNGYFTGYSPQQLANGFDYSGAYSAGFNGTGMTVGIIGTGPMDPNDMAAYAAAFHTPVANVQIVPVTPQSPSPQNGNTGTGASDPNPTGLASPPPVSSPTCFGPLPTCNPEDGEAQLDTESIGGLAPGANVLFYLAYNPSICVNGSTGAVAPPPCPSGYSLSPQIGIMLADDEIQQAIADNKADAISISYGGPENQQGPYAKPSTGLGPVEFASLAAEGIATFISSGDDGAWEAFDPTTGAPLGTPVVSYPASDVSVVGVGGVNIPLDSTGKLVNQITTWGDNTWGGGDGSWSNNVGSGGGISGLYNAPSFQTAALGPPPSMREVPDISLDADPYTGPALLMNASFPQKGIGASGGTSAAAPEAAAMWALVLQACKATPSCGNGPSSAPYRLGNPDALFYSIYHCPNLPCAALGSGAFVSHLPYSGAIYDVIYGSNQANPAPASPAPSPLPGYQAGPGYDMVTGVGAPFAGHLIQAITGNQVP